MTAFSVVGFVVLLLACVSGDTLPVGGDTGGRFNVDSAGDMFAGNGGNSSPYIGSAAGAPGSFGGGGLASMFGTAGAP